MSTSDSAGKTIICKAAVLWGKGESLKVQDVHVHPPKSSEVRIKMLFASLCHSDIFCISGFPAPLFPRIPGHEGAGVVESVGEGVRELKEGDLVMPTYTAECGKCENCTSTSPRTNLCLSFPFTLNGLMLDGTSRFSTTTAETDHDRRIYHCFSCSTWSEYTVVHVCNLMKLDPRIPLPHASLLSCGYSTGFGSTFTQVQLSKDSTVAVLGLGAVGLGVVEGARVQGAARIIGVDINERKREKGEVFGITDFINPTGEDCPDKPISELVKDLTGGAGVDYCFECTGVPSLLDQALQSTKAGVGTVVSIGGGSISAEISLVPLLCGRTLKGCIYGGIKVKSDLPFIFDKCINKELHLDELVTHQVSFNEINEAIKVMKQPDCTKILVKF
ncbi:Alcohol dehydrogenase [Bertholletia excelsa]